MDVVSVGDVRIDEAKNEQKYLEQVVLRESQTVLWTIHLIIQMRKFRCKKQIY